VSLGAGVFTESFFGERGKPGSRRTEGEQTTDSYQKQNFAVRKSSFPLRAAVSSFKPSLLFVLQRRRDFPFIRVDCHDSIITTTTTTTTTFLCTALTGHPKYLQS